MSEWQPIETAPKDGTSILIYIPASDDLSDWMMNAFWCGSHWEDEFSGGWIEPNAPTHWMPLPDPPTGTGTERESVTQGVTPADPSSQPVDK